MKRFGLLFSVLLMVFSGVAQKNTSVFRPLTWGQANALAASENKIVFVDLAVSGRRNAGKNVFTGKQMEYFFTKNVIAIHMDAETDAGKALVSKWMMDELPVYAFFMPYGDLLQVIRPANLTDPGVLMRVGEEALKLAEVKRNNSRSIQFMEISLSEAQKKAEEENKLIFIAGTADSDRTCLEMEKNIFTLDKVADFYNKNFINLKINLKKDREMVQKYGLSGFLTFLFLNGEGKKVYAAEGPFPSEAFIGQGKMALKKGEGIEFADHMPTRGERGDKLIFMVYSPYGGEARKQAGKNMFADPEVAELFNTRFLNIRKDSTLAMMQFINAGGEVVHQVAEVGSADDLMRQAERALKNNGLAAATAGYREGKREPEFVEEYLMLLERADIKKEAATVTLEYLSGLNRDLLKEKKYWDFFDKYVTDVNSDVFRYVYAQRNEFYSLFGEQNVKQKIGAVWMAGVEGFVAETGEEYRFDETGFKEYVKRMKKEKVEGWRGIARNGRMNIAEKAGDWRTYVELAEEKWNEEQIPDAELYSWGLKINRQCRDKAIRFKAARWFAIAASNIEQKERQNGKINLSSYKGFFEKLVDDLIRE